MKRMNSNKSTKTTLNFLSDSELGEKQYQIKVISDCLFGIDFENHFDAVIIKNPMLTE